MPTEPPLPKDIAGAIAEVNARLGAINLELATAERWRRLTSWWSDRATERQHLLRQRDRLIARQRELGSK